MAPPDDEVKAEEDPPAVLAAARLGQFAACAIFRALAESPANSG